MGRQRMAATTTMAGHTRVAMEVTWPPSGGALTTGEGGGGGLVRTQLGMAKFGVVNIWYKILNIMQKCGTNCPDSGHPRN